jgi:hypothetical protein
MAHRHPKRGDVKTTDGFLLAEAVIACGDVLMTDLRIQAQYAAWVKAHDLDRLARQLRVWQTRPYATALQVAVWGGPLPGELEALEAVLREMGVPFIGVSAQLLTKDFPARYATDYNPSMPPRFQAEAEMVSTAKKGRQPTAEALRSIRRHVEYWYAYEIKHPPDSIPELEKRERARTGEMYASSRHSTVIQGIQRVKRLLSVWERVEFSLQTLR